MSNVEVYDRGDRVLLFADFKDGAGVASNANVTLKTIDPKNVERTETLTNPSTGRYECEFTLSGSRYVPGIWEFRWEATGAVETAEEGKFELKKTRFS